MLELSTENWMAILFFITFLLWGIATFLFGRISVKHIEREMSKEGILPPEWDKGIGARMIAYAGIIILPNIKRHASLVNIEATKRFSRNRDKKYALLYVVSLLTLLFVVFTIAYLYAPES
jgi:hypothetical protein